MDIDIDTRVEVDVDIGRYVGCLKGGSKPVQVLTSIRGFYGPLVLVQESLQGLEGIRCPYKGCIYKGFEINF